MDSTFYIIAGGVTAVGTAILTVAGVWRLLTGPLTRAIEGIETVVNRLEARLSAHEQTHDADVKEIWKHLAQHRENRYEAR